MASLEPKDMDMFEESLGIEEVTEEEEEIYVASYWKLMWWRFRKHKMAIISTLILGIFYLVAVLCEFVAPYDPEQFFVRYKLAPPSKIHIFDAEGRLHIPIAERNDFCIFSPALDLCLDAQATPPLAGSSGVFPEFVL